MANMQTNMYKFTYKLKRFRQSLPPASEGWGKVIFSVCVLVHILTGGRDTPSQVRTGVLYQVQPDEGGGGTLYPRSQWGYPIPGLEGGTSS